MLGYTGADVRIAENKGVWIMRNVKTLVTLLGLVGAVLVTGCDSGGTNLQIEELQQQVDRLQTDRDDLTGRLAQALDAGDQARTMALQLQQQLDDCRRDLASRGMQQAPQPIAANPEGMDDWVVGAGFAAVSVSGDFLFDSGKSSLKQGGKSKVGEIAQQIKSNYPGRWVFVIGHTDNDPIMKTKNLYTDNLDLSQNRAAAVARELMGYGLQAGRMVVGGQGEFNPTVPNSSKDNKSKNRRVDIFAIEQGPTGV